MDEMARFLAIATDPLNWFWPVRSQTDLTSLRRRLDEKDKLRALAALTDSTVAEFLLEAIGKNVAAADKAIETLETKAASEIGFAGTIIAVFATLGRKDYLLAVAVPLALSILCNIRAMFVEEYALPSPVIYNLQSVVSDPANKARIALKLTEAYGDYSADLGVKCGRKSRYVRAGTLLLVVGVFMLLWAAWQRPPSSEGMSITCSSPPCVILATQPRGK